jgi:hypothetical protein
VAILDYDGLVNGERIKACSDSARLAFPYFLAAANTCSRFELDFARLCHIFQNFKKPFKEEQIAEFIKEYTDEYLLFTYAAEDGSYWGQIDTKWLPTYQKEADKKTPAPDPAEYARWQEKYAEKKRALSSKKFAALTQAAKSPRSSNGGNGHNEKRGSRIPEDFAVTQGHRDLAAKEQLPNPDTEIAKFKDYWKSQPGAKGVKLDWNATFNNWLRNALGYSQRPKVKNEKPVSAKAQMEKVLGSQ